MFSRREEEEVVVSSRKRKVYTIAPWCPLYWEEIADEGDSIFFRDRVDIKMKSTITGDEIILPNMKGKVTFNALAFGDVLAGPPPYKGWFICHQETSPPPPPPVFPPPVIPPPDPPSHPHASLMVDRDVLDMTEYMEPISSQFVGNAYPILQLAANTIAKRFYWNSLPASTRISVFDELLSYGGIPFGYRQNIAYGVSVIRLDTEDLLQAWSDWKATNEETTSLTLQPKCRQVVFSAGWRRVPNFWKRSGCLGYTSFTRNCLFPIKEEEEECYRCDWSGALYSYHISDEKYRILQERRRFYNGRKRTRPRHIPRK